MIWLIPLMLAAAPTADMPGSTRSLYLQLIHQARADGRPRAAIAYLDDFDRRYPGDVDARVLRVNALLDLGDLDGAETAAATLANGGGSAVRGHLLAARERWPEAIGFYRQAVAGSPADPMLRNALGYAQMRAGFADDAIESLRGALDLAPAAPVVRNNLILALMTGGKGAQAEALLNHVRDGRERDMIRRQIAAEATRLSIRKDR
ncbi:Flp pilus assembly protein TadD precursor [Sphingobium herbicidovorans NBRC 16415]|uniref:Flp pilus assembly protein TadD n=1 Tax=Sphingobium herbicidovorans (strain ATCC 700291 / DSM 11019 / CCUG 56400 / KCTC 2939 / LMG 18315 / NBRC 16415 / MH) TaxID=1219045 RepID=A0A086PC58_SPHHM|nr:tetratricopeptide repeat protein [Sphingobium herbicidovorans]KFG90976.1 Flp pilus assembly protein TadD precursor [Sphingobium herbicidovorans NBRC 16415]